MTENNQSLDTTKFRPISAVNKKPAFTIGYKKQNLSLSKTEFPKLQSDKNLFHDLATSKNNNISGISKERLYEELLQYKITLNALKKEIAFLKSDNNKRDIELKKKDKNLEKIVKESESNPFYSGNEAKNAYLIASMKVQFKDLKEELKNKEETIEKLKRQTKVTKFNELTLEINLLSDELAKLKTFYSIALQENHKNEQKINENLYLKESFTQQQKIISEQINLINAFEHDLKNKEVENSKLKEALNEYEANHKRLKREINNVKDINNRLLKNRNDSSAISNLKNTYEKKITELNKEIGRKVNYASEKESEIQDLKIKNKELVDKLSENRIRPNFDNIDEIKNISNNPNIENSMLLLYKSKLQEELREKQKKDEYISFLESKLKEYGFNDVYNIEKKIESSSNDYNNEVKEFKSFDQTNKSIQTKNDIIEHFDKGETLKMKESTPLFNTEEFTYILIKNLEGFGIDSVKAKNTILKEDVLLRAKNQPMILVDSISNSIISLLNISEKDDKDKIRSYIKGFAQLNEWNYTSFIENISILFENVKIYSEEEKKLYSKKLKKYLFPSIKILTKLSLEDDTKSEVTFYRLREILNELGIIIKDKYTEFLIYAMKSALVNKSNRLYNLSLSSLLSIISNANDDSNPNTSIEKSDNEDNSLNEEGENRIKEIIKSLADFIQKERLLTKSNGFINIFKNDYFRPQTEEGIELDVCIDLEVFIDFLRLNAKINISHEDQEILFKRYNLDEDYKVISLEKVEKDLLVLDAEMTFKDKGSSKGMNLIDEKDKINEEHDE